ncbi:MAG: phosphatase PAP2 family protein [Verrucomicrobiota bacterium]
MYKDFNLFWCNVCFSYFRQSMRAIIFNATPSFRGLNFVMRKENLQNPSGPEWPRTLMQRMFRLWSFKMIGTILVTWLFFKAYFWVLRNPRIPAYVMPFTFLDGWVSFTPWAVVLYISLWLYVALLPAVYKTLVELLIYLSGVLCLGSLGLAIFYFWPTTIQIPDAARRSVYSIFLILDGVDSAGNACPSLHVAFAVFTAVGFRRVLKEVRAGWGGHLVNLLWSVGICYSTLAIRQHVFWDLVAGCVLGMVVAAWTF